jgi:hypothetical protein
MRRHPGQEPPGLALGVGPEPQTERRVVSRELCLWQQEGIGVALHERPEARQRLRLVALPEQGFRREVGRVVGQEEVGGQRVEQRARPRVFPARQRDVGIAVVLEGTRRRHHGGPGQGDDDGEKEPGHEHRGERGPAALHPGPVYQGGRRIVPISEGRRGSPARCG